MVRVPLQKLIEWAKGSPDEKWLVKSIDDALHKSAGSQSKSKDDYLNDVKRGLADKYKRAVNVTAGEIKNVRQLVECWRVTGLPLEFDFRFQVSPWVRWVPGSDFIIVYGERKVQIPQVSSKMSQRAVGARDAEAIAFLVDNVRSELQIDCRVDLYPLPADLPADKASKELSNLLGRTKQGGAVVVIGSPIVNPLADPIAEMITDKNARGQDKNERNLPGKFRWRSARMDSYLSDVGKYPGEEGIFIRNANIMCSREADDDVFDELTRVPRRRRTFHDCGMLLMDCRQKDFLILCAGHGGCGTLGCVYALVDQQEEIATRLATEDDRMFAVVRVKREKCLPTPAEIDDLRPVRDEVELI